MTLSLLAAGGWVVVASLIAMLPRSLQGAGAVALVLAGIPLVGWITYQNGPFWGMLAMAAGVSVLRWPLVHLWRRLRRHLPGQPE